MTELKLSTAAEVVKPVEKIVEEVKTAVVEAPKAGDNNTATPVEVTPVVEQVVATG